METKTGNVYLITIQETCVWIENRIISIKTDMTDDLEDSEFYFLKGELAALNQVYRLLTM